MSTASQNIGHSHTFLQVLLTIFIGILVASFVGLGIAAFYPAPVSPVYPSKLMQPIPEKIPPTKVLPSDDAKKAQVEYEIATAAYQKNNDSYNRTVSSLALLVSILILALSLTVLQKVYLISDGLILGGVLTLIYSIIRSTISSDTKFQFIIVSVGLAITMALAYLKFIKPSKGKA